MAMLDLSFEEAFKLFNAGNDEPDSGIYSPDKEIIQGLGKKIDDSTAIIARPKMFGAICDGVSNDKSPVQQCITYLKSIGGGILDLSGHIKIVDGVDFIDCENIKIISNSGKVYYPQTTASYFHLFRVNGGFDITFQGLKIYSDSSLVRNDTGFAIQVTGTEGVCIYNCKFRDIASACVWIDNSDAIRAFANVVYSAKADGLHLSDGCSNFDFLANIVKNTGDDALAIVRDQGGAIPQNGTVVGNVVKNVLHGHGVVVVSSNDILIGANVISDTAAANIGCYIWSGTTDRSLRIKIFGNQLYRACTAPLVNNNACAILLAGVVDTTVSKNTINGVQTGHAWDDEISAFRCTSYDRLYITDNDIFDIVKYGAYVPDAISSGLGEIFVLGNRWNNVGSTVFKAHLAGVGVLGKTHFCDNRLTNCAYLSPYWGCDIAQAGADRVTITGNKSDGNLTWYFDQATCSNVRIGDNDPITGAAFTPNARSWSAPFTTIASQVGSFWRSGGMVEGYAIINITTAGSTGLLIDVPVTLDARVRHITWHETTTNKFGVGWVNDAGTVIAIDHLNAVGAVFNGANIRVNFRATPA